MRLTTRLRADGFWWSLVDARPDPQPVARGTRGCTDVDACAKAAAQVLAAGPDQIHPVAQAAGGWRWVVCGPDGQALAESPQVFATAAACGYALHDVRHALGRHGLDVTGPRHHDMARR